MSDEELAPDVNEWLSQRWENRETASKHKGEVFQLRTLVYIQSSGFRDVVSYSRSQSGPPPANQMFSIRKTSPNMVAKHERK
jgi:hypothetical protein